MAIVKKKSFEFSGADIRLINRSVADKAAFGTQFGGLHGSESPNRFDRLYARINGQLPAEVIIGEDSYTVALGPFSVRAL